MAENEERIFDGGGNVFADLGLSDTEELLVCTPASPADAEPGSNMAGRCE
jgi:hypothetical protein